MACGGRRGPRRRPRLGAGLVLEDRFGCGGRSCWAAVQGVKRRLLIDGEPVTLALPRQVGRCGRPGGGRPGFRLQVADAIAAARVARDSRIWVEASTTPSWWRRWGHDGASRAWWWSAARRGRSGRCAGGLLAPARSAASGCCWTTWCPAARSRGWPTPQRLGSPTSRWWGTRSDVAGGQARRSRHRAVAGRSCVSRGKPGHLGAGLAGRRARGLGADPGVGGRVRDLEPALLGRVEQLIDSRQRSERGLRRLYLCQIKRPKGSKAPDWSSTAAPRRAPPSRPPQVDVAGGTVATARRTGAGRARVPGTTATRGGAEGRSGAGGADSGIGILRPGPVGAVCRCAGLRQWHSDRCASSDLSRACFEKDAGVAHIDRSTGV